MPFLCIIKEYIVLLKNKKIHGEYTSHTHDEQQSPNLHDCGWVGRCDCDSYHGVLEIMLIKFVLYAVRISVMQAKLEQPIAQG